MKRRLLLDLGIVLAQGLPLFGSSQKAFLSEDRREARGQSDTKQVYEANVCKWIIILPLVCRRIPPLWSSGQSSWLQIQRSRVRFPALPDFLRSSGSRTGSIQPREYN
jgi:hypothetical protein